jgi:hypothetical protein
VTPRWKRRKRHAASRARKLAAVLSVCAFVAIGQAINLAAPVSTAHNGALVQSAGSQTSLLSASKRPSTVSAAPRTTKAVTSTHAG